MEQALHLLLAYKYAILLPLALIEGPSVAIVAGVLVSLGYLNFSISYFILIGKDMFVDSVYYFLGRYGEKKNLVARYGHKVGLTEVRFQYFKKLWTNHFLKTMFFSKLAYGVGVPMLISAGLSSIAAKKFFFFAFVIALLQYAGLMALGVYFGDSYMRIASYVKGAEVLLIVVALLVGGYFLISFYLRKRILKEND